jgi:AGZA family xanthine/uracil permease-like MFS transporter
MVMILAYSISDGIGFGFLTYVVVMVSSRKAKEVSPLLYVATALFIAYIVFLNVV